MQKGGEYPAKAGKHKTLRPNFIPPTYLARKYKEKDARRGVAERIFEPNSKGGVESREGERDKGKFKKTDRMRGNFGPKKKKVYVDLQIIQKKPSNASRKKEGKKLKKHCGEKSGGRKMMYSFSQTKKPGGTNVRNGWKETGRAE